MKLITTIYANNINYVDNNYHEINDYDYNNLLLQIFANQLHLHTGTTGDVGCSRRHQS